jgi:hypothetical protein
MPTLIIENFKTVGVSIGIEPWADVETVEPRGRVEIDYDEPAEISFSLDADGGATLGIVSDRVIVRGETERSYALSAGDS